MDADQFRECGKAMIDYIADYYENIRDRQVLPSIEPGYLEPLVPKEAPQTGESWQDVLKDVDRIIMPGVTHWLSPNFYAYYPTANSFPGVLGEMLSAGLGVIGFNWMVSPACTELEVIVMDWLGKLLQLPEEFLNCSDGPGGGVIQGTASEASLVALLAAKEKSVRLIQEKYPHMTEAEIKGKLVAYSSDQSNSSVEKAGLIGSMTMRLLPSDEEGVLHGETIREAVRSDKEKGLIPCFVLATLGTTGTCAFDDLMEIGPICNEENLWLHIDAAYAGTAFTCPEYRHHMNGVEYADSFNFNCHKWMLVNFDCSAMWVKDAGNFINAFNVDRIYLKHNKISKFPDYRHWQIPLGRRFRALKLWFVLRMYGVEGIQKHVRTQIDLAKFFENLVRNDDRFELCTSSLGLVTFRIQGENNLTQELLDLLAARKNIYVVPCHYRNKLVVRFAICSRATEVRDVENAWREICSQTEVIIGSKKNQERNILNPVVGDKLINKFGGIKISSNTESVEKSK